MTVDTKEKPFLVETARHSRAICKKCRQKCVQGNLRLARLAPNPVGSGTMKTWHHVDCIFELFLRQRKTTKRIEGVHDIEGWESLDNNDKIAIKKKIEDCNEILNAKQHSSSKKSETVSPQKNPSISDPPTTEESTCGTPERMSDVEEDRGPEFHHNSFRYFRIIIYDVSSARSADAKSNLLRTFFQDGTDGTGFKSDIFLWCKFLIPTATNRRIPFTPEQLVNIFCEIFDLNPDEPSIKQRLDKREHVSRKIPKLFDISKKYRPNSNYSLTLQEVDEFLEMLSAADETEQIHHLNNIITKCGVRDLRFIIRLILQDLRMEFTAEHVCGAIHPEAYAMYQSCKDIKAVVEKYWKQPSESERRRRSSPSKSRRRDSTPRSESKGECQKHGKSDTKSDKTEATKKEVQGGSSTHAEASKKLPHDEGDLSTSMVKIDISPKTETSESSLQTAAEKKPSKGKTHRGTSKNKPRKSSDQATPDSSSTKPKDDTSSTQLKDDPSSSQAKTESSSSKGKSRKRSKKAKATDTTSSQVEVNPDLSQAETRKSSDEAKPGPSFSPPKSAATFIKKKISRRSNPEAGTSRSRPLGKYDFEYNDITGEIYHWPEAYKQARDFYPLRDEQFITLSRLPFHFKGDRVLAVNDFMGYATYRESICLASCLGARITYNPEEATHVLYPESRLNRLPGLDKLIHVSTAWLKHTIEKNRVQSVKDYAVTD